MSIKCVGELIERIKSSVQQFGAHPHTPIVVRLGDLGVEMEIEHVKLRNSLDGPVIILQLATRQ